MANVVQKIEAGLCLAHGACLQRFWRRLASRPQRTDSSLKVVFAKGASVPCALRCGGVAPGSSVFGPRIPARVFEGSAPVGRDFPKFNRCSAGAWVEFETASTDFEVELCESRRFTSVAMAPSAEAAAELFCMEPEVRRIGFVMSRSACSARAVLAVRENRAFVPRRYRLVLPLFSQIDGVLLRANDGVSFEDACTSGPSKRVGTPRKAVAFYGSSVTHGCAASGPSATIPARVASLCGVEAYNFGFSGSAYGEPEIATYLGGLPIDALVVEYDHNCDLDYLRGTHLAFYKAFRRRSSLCPVVFVSRASGGLSVSDEEAALRREVIEATVAWARGHGDDHVSWVNGNEVVPKEGRWRYFADDRHPNQLGIERLAKAIARELESVLKGAGR